MSKSSTRKSFLLFLPNIFHYDFSEVAYTDVTTDARVLFDAVRHGKTHLVRFILEASAIDVVNARDLHGKTPLMTCCYTKEEGARDKTVKLLLRHGADVNLTDDFGRTVLSYACEKRCNDILRILVKHHNIDPDIADQIGNTALIYSAVVGNDIACDILVRHFRRLGLNVDAVNEDGFTALLCAAKHGNVTCAQILIGHGKASMKYRDKVHGLSFEEWLQKKGFSLQDVTPYPSDGKGRSRFVKFGNIAAICSASKKLAQLAKQPSQEFEYPLKGIHLGDFGETEDDDGDDATTADGVPVSVARFYTYKDRCPEEWFQEENVDFRLFPHANMISEETQTSDIDSDPDMKKANRGMSQNRKRPNQNRLSDGSLTNLPANQRPDATVNQSSKKETTEKDKRYSLPDIGAPGKGGCRRGKDRKQSLQALPEVLIADVDLGDGRHKHIQLRSDPLSHNFYWKPCLEEDEEDTLTNIMSDMSLDRKRDSETSSVDDGSVF